ncbi:SurA N-terminal domain-containing protein [bacterium]|nr:SurA N-terminal domain-containing protein [bacterium]|tara:strand:- start:1819 stop:3300 length:1482 start_codon:yes stop_codon:yes gene_type:complete
MYSFISKLIIFVLTAGLIISLGAGTEFISFGMGKDVVAKVNNMKISKQEFDFFKNKKISELSLSANYKSEKAFRDILDLQIVQMIASRKILADFADEIGLYISDKEIRDKILDDNFLGGVEEIEDPKIYKKVIKKNFNLDWNIFEEIIKEEALNDKLSSFFSETILISSDETYEEFLSLETKFNYIKISLNEDLEIDNNFTEKEIEAYLKENKDSFKSKLEYLDFITISGEDLIKNITISSDDIRSYHENYLPDQPFDEVNIRKVIKDEIAKKSILSELDTINELIINNSFEQISKKYDVKILTISKDSYELPDSLKSKAISSNDIQFTYYDDKIWIFRNSKDLISQRELLISMMKEDRQNIARKNFFIKLIDLYSANPAKFNSVIKSDSNLDLQFYYDESKKYNPNINSFVKSVDLENYGSFLIDKVFIDSNYYLIFIEKIRLPDDDLFILEKERINRSLYIEKSENFINSIKKELVSDAEVKLNNKYFSDK